MKRTQVLDFSIHGDDLEQHRIALENDLQNTEFSLRLESDSEVEYPRHNSLHMDRSFIRRDWEYGPDHDDDDENGISPYGGRTISTAGHHASGVTLNAGLVGRATRRDNASMSSGAEFDPDRPLRDLIAGADSKFSLFDADSRYAGQLAADDTAELDRVLQSGLAPMRMPTPPRSDSSASSSSGSDSPSRPRLQEALRHVSFSPKRPRSGTGVISPRSAAAQLPRQQPTSPLGRGYGADEQTPRPPKRTTASHTPKPEVRLQPPTPSRSSNIPQKLPARRDPREDDDGERNPFHDVGNYPESRRSTAPAPSRRTQNYNQSNVSKSRLHLPDVTGLTSAVESPARPGLDRYGYADNGQQKESHATLIQVVTTIQGQLSKMELENGVSRRRIKELEHELEICKEDVAKERTRVLEANELATGRSILKGKATARHPDPDLTVRYKEVVEEKKALESLIQTLRSHLTRLTAELSSHQALLLELKSLRDADAKTLKEKSREIVRLREEVERLGGEVEVLKGVVEEGLKERRDQREREQSLRQEREDSMPLEYVTYDEDRVRKQPPPRTQDEEEDHDEPFDPRSIPGSSRFLDKTMRTDHATLGSSVAARMRNKERFIGDATFERIATEVTERQSNSSRDRQDAEEEAGPSRRPHAHFRQQEEQQEEFVRPSAPTPAHASHHHRDDKGRNRAHHDPPFPKIRGERMEQLFFKSEHNVKTCTMCQRRKRRPGGAPAPEDGRPLSPSWMPTRLAETSPYRRLRQQQHQHRHESDDEEDERFEDEAEDLELQEVLLKTAARKRGQRDTGRGNSPKQKLPPQRVLAKVIKEMEDDFAHYKSVYVELAEQYRIVDAASDVAKRNLVAQHLREVIDIIEQKGDQIASLYELLDTRDP